MRFLKSFFSSERSQEIFVLLDIETNAVLVLGNSYQVMNYLTEFVFDTYISSLPIRNYTDKLFYKNLEKSENIYEFKIDPKNGYLVKNTNIVDNLKDKSAIAKCKYQYFSKMYNVIEFRRLRNTGKKSLAFQELIYMAKKQEANLFKGLGYPEKDILEYPYILQYAEYKNISLKQATDEILFKAKIGDTTLARTEILRLKYFNKIKEAKTKEEVEKAFKEFESDFGIT